MTPPEDATGGSGRAEPAGAVRTAGNPGPATTRAATSLIAAGSLELYRLLVASVRDYAIFALDSTGHIVSWNEGAQRLKGYAPHEIIGRHFSTFYPQADVDAGKPAWELEIATREGKYEEEGWRVRKDGTLFWANVLITALRGPDGSLVGFAKVTRDLTERRAAQQRAIEDAKRVAEAEAASRTKSEFLTAMSHELRTPINATKGYVELLEMGVGGDLTDQQRDYLSRIRRSQEHLLGVITDLLNYGRIEAGHVSLDIEPVPIDGVVETVLTMVEPQAERSGLTIHRTPCPPRLIARADRTKTEQIVLNLLSNAVKFTPSGGRVSVACEAKDAQVLVRVADTGPGIEPEHQARIFEPFVQVGRSLSSTHEGTGLGLTISRQLARAMGGDVTVESKVGEGSTFLLSLPCGDAAA